MTLFTLLALGLGLFLGPTAPPADQTADVIVPDWTLELAQWAEPGHGIRALHPAGDAVLVEDESHGITALDPATGEMLWFTRLPDALHGDVGVSEQRLVLSTGDRVVVVDSASGGELHEGLFRTEPAATPVASAQALFEPSLQKDSLYALTLGSGSLAWRYRSLGGFHGTTRLVKGAEGNLLLLPCADGTLQALPAGLDLPEGPRWTLDAGMVVSGPTVEDGLVFVATERRRLMCLDASGGRTVWSAGTAGLPLTAPMVCGDAIVLTTSDGVVAFDREAGFRRWLAPARERPVGGLDGLVVVRRRNHTLVARDLQDGRQRTQSLGAFATVHGNRLLDWSDGRSVRASRSTLAPTEATEAGVPAEPAGSVH
jgi:outer membrane protein assembly factor BamB